jgi:hypothetical protein
MMRKEGARKAKNKAQDRRKMHFLEIFENH